MGYPVTVATLVVINRSGEGPHKDVTTTETGRAALTLPGYRDGRLHSIAGRPITLFTDFDVDLYNRNARGRIKVAKAKVKPMPAGVRDDLAFLWRLDSGAVRGPACWPVGPGTRRGSPRSSPPGPTSGCGSRTPSETCSPPTAVTFPSLWAVTQAVRQGAQLLRRARWPIVVPVWTSIAGESVTAGHVAPPAVQEVSLQAAYAAPLPRLEGEASRVVHEIVDRRDEMTGSSDGGLGADLPLALQEARDGEVAPCVPAVRSVSSGAPDPDETRALASIFRPRRTGSGSRAQTPTCAVCFGTLVMLLKREPMQVQSCTSQREGWKTKKINR